MKQQLRQLKPHVSAMVRTRKYMHRRAALEHHTEEGGTDLTNVGTRQQGFKEDRARVADVTCGEEGQHSRL